jgi:aspartate racemase
MLSSTHHSTPGADHHRLGPFVGILGGMGPLATVDLMEKIVRLSGAQRDQEHVPVVAHNVAQIADRQVFLQGAGPSPLPALYAGLDRLNSIGAGVIVIPCNTAHIWYEQLAQHSAAPIVHIADAAIALLARRGVSTGRIGVIGTAGTIAAGFYQERLRARGYESVVNTESEFKEWFTPGCYAVKAGRVAEGGQLFARATDALTRRGASYCLLACTEVPLGLAAINYAALDRTIDATAALALAAIDWWQQRQLPQPLSAQA